MVPPMEMRKTYPPEVEAIRSSLIEAIEQIKTRYREKVEGPDAVSATALTMLARPRTNDDFANLHRGYLAEVEPFLRRLTEMEGFASISFVVRDDESLLVPSRPHTA